MKSHSEEDIRVHTIQAKDTWELRHRVMWPGRDISYVKLPKDEEGRHFGLFVQGRLVSVVSLFIQDGKAQFRKFATEITEQGKGYGSLLLNEVIEYASHEPVQTIWCNARRDKTAFYTKFGLRETAQTFEKGGVVYVIMEKTV